MDTFPLLPLDTFRRILGWQPWHFHGLADTELTPETSSCPDLIHAYAWQEADLVGRSEIRDALLQAESMLTAYLGFGPAPRFNTWTLEYPRHLNKDLWRMGSMDGNGRWSAVRLPEGQVRKLGVETYTLIGPVQRHSPVDPADTLLFADDDGDGLYENFSASIATTVTDADELGLYFVAADQSDGATPSERWRVAPVRVALSGGVAYFYGKTWNLVRPILEEGVDADSPFDPTDRTATGPFAFSLNVYRRYCNPDGTTVDTAQGKLIWETEPYPVACCGDGLSTATEPAAEATAVARVGIRDANAGLVIPGAALYNTTTATWGAAAWGLCRPPDRVMIRALAGYPLQSGEMHRTFQTAVTRLAVAELARPLCGCETANREVGRWQFDLARSAGANDEAYTTSPRDLENPFGTRRGHVYAWNAVRSLRLARGLVAG